MQRWKIHQKARKITVTKWEMLLPGVTHRLTEFLLQGRHCRWSPTHKCPFSELTCRVRAARVLHFVTHCTDTSHWNKIWIQNGISNYFASGKFNTLCKCKVALGSWGKKFTAPFWGEHLQQSTLQNEMQYCHLLPRPESIPSPTDIQRKMRSMFQDKESFNHNENVILTDPRSHYINTVFKAFLIIQLTISAIPLRELKTKKLKGYWPIQFQFLK